MRKSGVVDVLQKVERIQRLPESNQATSPKRRSLVAYVGLQDREAIIKIRDPKSGDRVF
jgi:hypothetical protein